MKVLVSAVLVFVFLLGFGIISYYYVDNTSTKLVEKTENVEKHVQSGNWKEAEKQFTNLKLQWNDVNEKWTILLDHQELDNINISMAKTKKYIDTRYIPGFMSESAQLKMLLKHIPEKEALNLKNIL